jgi:hypothetical protein
MERSTPKRKDYTDDERVPGPNAVKPRTAPDFTPIKLMSIPMRDNLARCAEYRAMGKSYRRAGE